MWKQKQKARWYYFYVSSNLSICVYDICRLKGQGQTIFFKGGLLVF